MLYLRDYWELGVRISRGIALSDKFLENNFFFDELFFFDDKKNIFRKKVGKIFEKSQNFIHGFSSIFKGKFRKFSEILRFSKNRKFQQARFWGSGCAGSVYMVVTRSIGHLAPFLQTLYSVSLPDRFWGCYRARKVKKNQENHDFSLDFLIFLCICLYIL